MTLSYFLNEGQLTIPSQWQDESMNMFTFPNETGGNLVINRTPVPFGLDKDEYYAQVIEQFRQNLQGYQENAYQQVTLAEQEAHLLDYQWKTPEGVMYQLSLLQIRQNKLLSFTYTFAEPIPATQKTALLNILYTFQPAE